MSLVGITATPGNVLWAAGGPATPGVVIYVPDTAAAQLTASGQAAYASGSGSTPSQGGSMGGSGATTGPSSSSVGWYYADLVAGTNGAPAIPATGFTTAFCRDARVLDQGVGKGTGTMVIGSGGSWLMLSGGAVHV